MKKIVIIFLFFINFQAFASEVRYLARGPRGLLLGDAYTALVADEYVLFYNPAAIAKNDGIEFESFNPDISISYLLDDIKKFENFPKDAPGIADRVTGIPLYIHAGYTPTLKMGPFAFSLLYNSSTSLVLDNAIHPVIDIDYRYDRGFIMGYAQSWGKGTRPKKKGRQTISGRGWRSSIGASFKWVKREGLQGRFSLFGTRILNIVSDNSSGDYKKILKAIGYSRGKGWGADIGFQHLIYSGSSELIFAASVMNVGDMRFRLIEGIRAVPQQDMMINAGAAYKYTSTLLDYSLSLDLHPINAPIANMRKLHIGFGVGIPLISILTGWSAGYISYGVELNFWLFKLTAGIYGVEIGEKFQQRESRRAVVYLNFFSFSLDDLSFKNY